MASLVVGLDLGTGNMGIVAQHFDGKETSKTPPITIVYLKNREDREKPEVKQIALYLDNGKLVYGSDVRDALRTNQHLQDRVIELSKLALHPEFHHVAEVIHARTTLRAEKDRGAMQDFFADLLRCIARDVREFFKDRVMEINGGDSATYWDQIPLTFQISVPAMWKDEQRGIIRNAARNAGIARIELREEPLCVASMYVPDLILEGNMQQGQSLLLADIGKGTCDITLTMVDRLDTANNHLELKRIGLCSGNGSGSHELNRLFWQWLCSGNCAQVRDINTACNDLHLTPREFMRQASDKFDRVKEDFSPDGRGYSVTIYGAEGSAEAFSLLAIHIPQALIEGWYAQWTSGAAKLLREHIAQVTEFAEKHNLRLEITCATLTGGGSKSEALQDAMGAVLRELLPKTKIRHKPLDLPCAQGTLMHHFFQEDSLPPVAHFYIARTEYYQRGKHRKDAAEVSRWDTNEQIVKDRLRWIMTYNEKGFLSKDMAPQQFYVAADGTLGRLHVDLYWSEQRFNSSSALFDKAGKMRAGIRRYPLVFADVPDLASYGFQSEEADGERYFLVKGWTEMKGTKDKLELILYIMKQGYQYPAEHPKEQHGFLKIPCGKADIDEKDILGVYPEEVWSKDSSHFVSSSTGQCARD